MASRQLAPQLPLQQRRIRPGNADTEPLVQLLANVLLPSRKLIHLVEKEPPRPSLLNQRIQPSRVPHLELRQQRRLEIDVKPRLPASANALAHDRGLAAAAHARDVKRMRLEQNVVKVQRPRLPDRLLQLDFPLLGNNSRKLAFKNHHCHLPI